MNLSTAVDASWLSDGRPLISPSDLACAMPEDHGPASGMRGRLLHVPESGVEDCSPAALEKWQEAYFNIARARSEVPRWARRLIRDARKELPAMRDKGVREIASILSMDIRHFQAVKLARLESRYWTWANADGSRDLGIVIAAGASWVRDGLWVRVASNGHICAHAQFSAGQLEGCVWLYDDHGEVQWGGCYRAGLLNGRVKTFNRYGELRSRETWSRGERIEYVLVSPDCTLFRNGVDQEEPRNPIEPCEPVW